jgi:hypothetical protein
MHIIMPYLVLCTATVCMNSMACWAALSTLHVMCSTCYTRCHTAHPASHKIHMHCAVW